MLKNKLTEYDKIEHSDGLIIWYQKHSEEIVGIVSLRPHNGQTWICSLYVSPDFRGLGICRDILDYATFNGGNHLSVRKTNTRAVDIYKKYGFTAYDDDDDCWYMSIINNIGVYDD